MIVLTLGIAGLGVLLSKLHASRKRRGAVLVPSTPALDCGRGARGGGTVQHMGQQRASKHGVAERRGRGELFPEAAKVAKKRDRRAALGPDSAMLLAHGDVEDDGAPFSSDTPAPISSGAPVRKARTGKKKAPTTLLLLEVEGDTVEVELDLAGVCGFDDMHELVAEALQERAGLDPGQLNGLMMGYQLDESAHSDGIAEFVMVTRATTLDVLLSSPQLKLAPANSFSSS